MKWNFGGENASKLGGGVQASGLLPTAWLPLFFALPPIQQSSDLFPFTCLPALDSSNLSLKVSDGVLPWFVSRQSLYLFFIMYVSGCSVSGPLCKLSPVSAFTSSLSPYIISYGMTMPQVPCF